MLVMKSKRQATLTWISMGPSLSSRGRLPIAASSVMNRRWKGPAIVFPMV